MKKFFTLVLVLFVSQALFAETDVEKRAYSILNCTLEEKTVDTDLTGEVLITGPIKILNLIKTKILSGNVHSQTLLLEETASGRNLVNTLLEEKDNKICAFSVNSLNERCVDINTLFDTDTRYKEILIKINSRKSESSIHMNCVKVPVGRVKALTLKFEHLAR